jgi:hypothetical protein
MKMIARAYPIIACVEYLRLKRWPLNIFSARAQGSGHIYFRPIPSGSFGK